MITNTELDTSHTLGSNHSDLPTVHTEPHIPRVGVRECHSSRSFCNGKTNASVDRHDDASVLFDPIAAAEAQDSSPIGNRLEKTSRPRRDCANPLAINRNSDRRRALIHNID